MKKIKVKDVIAKAEEKEIAEKLKEEYCNMEMSLSDLSSEGQEDDEIKLTPIEEMTSRIISQLVSSAHKSFSDMVDGIDPRIVLQLINRMDESGNFSAVKMLQAMFYLTGNIRAAEELDIVDICAEFDDSAYDLFVDELISPDMCDSVVTEICLKLYGEEPFITVVSSNEEDLNGTDNSNM